MILTYQLLVGNWSDLHANGLCLLNGVGGSGTITRGDVQILFYFCALPLDFAACGETNKHVDFTYLYI